MPCISDVPYLDNTGMVALDHVPEHLVIVGGGYVGLEFAQMYRRFGARVTIIERGSRLAAHEDEDISAALAEMLVAEGVVVRTDADCVALESDDKGIAVTVGCLQGDSVDRKSVVEGKSGSVRVELGG